MAVRHVCLGRVSRRARCSIGVGWGGRAGSALRGAVCGLLFAAAVGVEAGAAWGQDMKSPYPAPGFVPPAERPRVYFTAKDLPRLRENALKPQNAKAWAEHLQNLEAGTDGVLAPPTDASGANMDSKVLSVISSLAYDFALRGNEANGKRAVEAMRNYVRTVVYPPKDYNNTGQTVFTLGVVYDWCHPLLSAEDKDVLYRAMLDTAAKMEIGWPPVQQGNVTGHGPEGQLFRDLLVASAAVHGEHPGMYAMVGGRILDRMVEPKKFMYPAHMHHQGVHYCNYRGQWEMLATWIFGRMGLPQVFGAEQQYLMYWTMYARRGDGTVLRDGDTHINNRPIGEYWASPFRTMFLSANYFGDPYLKAEAMRIRPGLEPMAPRQNQACDAVEVLIFNDPDLAPRPMSELPLSKYFPSPKGGMIARTSWEDGPASAFGPDKGGVVAEMKINEWYFANHQHLDAGAFQIYYRGALALDSGYYQAWVGQRETGVNDGSSGYGSLYDVNYYKRSVAHNVITVHDPAEKFENRRWARYKMSNDGGQRMPNLWQEPQEHEEFLDPKNGYRIAEVLGHGFGPDAKTPEYTYLKGDLAKAYSAKISGYERSFVFLNLGRSDVPAAMVVMDRVASSNPSFRKAWLLHGLEEPAIVGNRTVFKDTRKGYTGKLTTDTLIPAPEDTTITPIGGPGKESWVDGINYEVRLRPEGVNEGGQWRIEVSPKTARTEDVFLHVLQTGEHTPVDAPALAVRKIETPTHVGAIVADRVVVLSRGRDRIGSAVAFSFTGDGESKILVADLKPGLWRVERDGQPAGEVTVSDASGVAYFGGRSGDYKLTPATK